MTFTLGFSTTHSKMPHYNHDRPWTNDEWVVYLHFGRIQCSVLGYQEWFRREWQNFQISIRIYDHETTWVNRENNRFPVSSKERADRRALLRRLNDDFAEFTNLVRVQTAMIQQNVANQHQNAGNQDQEDDVVALN